MSSTVVAKSPHVCEKLLLERSGKVYDCSKFADRHPGGRKVLQCFNGKDVTGIMRAKPHRHSKPALYLMESYKHSGSKRSLASTADHSEVFKRSHDTVDNDCAQTQQVADLEHLVDWSQPMFWQVGRLGAQYKTWVHLPVDRELILFQSSIAEFLSKTPWYMVPAVWLPVLTCMIWRGVSQTNSAYSYSVDVRSSTSLLGSYIGTFALLLVFGVGVLSWTLVEYCLHRFLFHAVPPSKSPFLISLHFLLHGQHHKVPFDPGRLVFPPVPASVFVILIYSAAVILLPGTIANIGTAGMLLGYVCYDLTHYFLHHGVPAPGGYFDRLRKYHIQHHFAQQSRGFGISSKLWDQPFSTLIIEDYSEEESDFS